DAAIVEVERLGTVERTIAAGTRVHCNCVALARIVVQVGDASIGWIDDDRRAPRRFAALEPMRRRPGAVASSACPRRRKFFGVGLGLACGLCLAICELLVVHRVATCELLRPLERHSELVVGGEQALNVRVAPWCAERGASR